MYVYTGCRLETLNHNGIVKAFLFINARGTNALQKVNFYCPAKNNNLHIANIFPQKTLFTVFIIYHFQSYPYKIYLQTKELSLWHELKNLNPYIVRTRCCKHLIFQTQII